MTAPIRNSVIARVAAIEPEKDKDTKPDPPVGYVHLSCMASSQFDMRKAQIDRWCMPFTATLIVQNARCTI
jgi:hypothetical protein